MIFYLPIPSLVPYIPSVFSGLLFSFLSQLGSTERTIVVLEFFIIVYASTKTALAALAGKTLKGIAGETLAVFGYAALLVTLYAVF